MVLVGLCISRSGIDIALVSAEDGALQEFDSTPLAIDPMVPDTNALVAPFTSLRNQYPSELTVLATSTQLRARDREAILPQVGLTGYDCSTIDYISAYVAGLSADEVASAPYLLFIEITPTIFFAQLVTVHLEGTKHIHVPVYVEATTSSMTTLTTFVGQVFAWVQDHNYKLYQCVLLDPPSGSVDSSALQTTLDPNCPTIIVDGTHLAKSAAASAFLNIEELRDPHWDFSMCMAPCPISFLMDSRPPTLIIQDWEPLPSFANITFTISEENQTSISVEFAFGQHEARPDDKLIFAKLTLGGLRPSPAGQAQITVSTCADAEGNNRIELFQGTEGENALVRAVAEIPYHFLFRAYNVFGSLRM
ncbi:hypothetical protein M413DRAFT_28229 [Hebeloma cylindrosporum]|uniref:Uncharacterized protein n=1 Tax=Hebeloma cylindrosporum TaxID=76867 RepID=A0A0C3CAD0_HEBCY|nr:hypothetical protein M413DRAFT_28229 [Hebeloma cylindrosporum h7]